jgi:hypothetical protein
LHSLIGLGDSLPDKYGQYNFKDIDEDKAEDSKVMQGANRLPDRIADIY